MYRTTIELQENYNKTTAEIQENYRTTADMYSIHSRYVGRPSNWKQNYSRNYSWKTNFLDSAQTTISSEYRPTGSVVEVLEVLWVHCCRLTPAEQTRSEGHHLYYHWINIKTDRKWLRYQTWSSNMRRWSESILLLAEMTSAEVTQKMDVSTDVSAF